MIEITRIRITDMSLNLPSREKLEELRTLLSDKFGTKNILFEYNDTEEEQE
jgi:hypothetical protein